MQLQNRPLSTSAADIKAAFGRLSLAMMLGWQDIRQRYRRSALGPFWLTISTSILVACIGLVFGHLFKAPMKEFLPFLAAGLVTWSYITTTITEGCTAFTSADHIIKQLPIPLFVHVLRVIWRNAVIFAHNIVILPLVLFAMDRSFAPTAVVSILGFALVSLNLCWVSLILSTICTRYRDFPQMVASLMQVLFYITPIMWQPQLLPDSIAKYLLDYNPLFHLIEIVRSPLLGGLPTATNWAVSAGLAVLGWPIALFLFGTYKRRIAYWL